MWPRERLTPEPRARAREYGHRFPSRQVVHKLLHLLEQVHLVYDPDRGRVEEQNRAPVGRCPKTAYKCW
jgi:hypothetical protein